MAQVGTRLGGKAFNHSQSAQAEEEYDRLRTLARQEHGKMQSCFDRAHQAYASGDGATAHTLSASGKQHQSAAAAYNAQASAFIFRENNSPAHGVAADTIDLHGQYVEEAAAILETRIRAARERGETHLHVIVGKGIHSPGHVRKIEPEVERICRAEGLRFRIEENEGRIFVDLTGGGGGGVGGGYGGQQYQQQQQGGEYSGYAGQPYQQQQYPPPSFQPQQQQYPSYNQAPGFAPQQPQHQFQQEQQQQQPQQDPLISCLKGCCIVM